MSKVERVRTSVGEMFKEEFLPYSPEWSKDYLCHRLELFESELDCLLEGDNSLVSDRICETLSDLTGVSKAFWINLRDLEQEE